MKFSGTQKFIIHLAVIVCAGIFVYSNTLHSPFVFDDYANILDNPTIRDLSYFANPAKVKKADAHITYLDIILNFKTRYVANLTFAINYIIGGANPAGYHIFNISIHIINAVIIYILSILIFRNHRAGKEVFPDYELIAFFAALIFVCHPMQTQAVTYITQRYASLAALFYLLSVTAYAKYLADGKRGGGYYAVALISVIMAMFTKEHAITLPVMIAVYDWMFYRESTAKRLKRLAPFILTISIIPLTLLYDARDVSRGIGDNPFTRWEYLFTQFTVIVKYIRMYFIPVGQNLDHDVPLMRSILQSSVLISLASLVAIFSVAAWLFRQPDKKGPEPGIIAFGIFWIFVTMSIESSVFPIGEELMFEHRFYLPSAGLIIAFMGAVAWAWRIKKITDTLFVTTMSVIVIILSVAGYARNMVWQSEKTLWEDAVSKSPRKARPLSNIGLVLLKEGRVEEAQRYLAESVKIQPMDVDATTGLGEAYEKLGDTTKAVELYQRALSTKSDFAPANERLANAMINAGKLGEAESKLSGDIRLRPDKPAPHLHLGLIYARQHKYAEAAAEYQTALRLNPEYAEAHYNLASVYVDTGRLDDAIAEYRLAIKIRPHFVDAHTGLGVAFAMSGRMNDAIVEFREALRYQPDNAEAKYNLERAMKEK